VVLLTTRFSEAGNAHQDRNRFRGFTGEIIQKTVKAIQNVLRCLAQGCSTVLVETKRFSLERAASMLRG
jgi:hypothetical protein